MEVQLTASDADVPAGAEFTDWVEAALAAAGCDCVDREMTVRLVDEAESAELNQGFRQQPGPTNVLAFPGPDSRELPGDEPLPFGDLVVCLPLVYREAEDQAKTALDHLAHLVIHGTLHLCGYTHDKDSNAQQMEELEVRVMTDLGYADPYRREESPAQHG